MRSIFLVVSAFLFSLVASPILAAPQQQDASGPQMTQQEDQTHTLTDEQKAWIEKYRSLVFFPPFPPNPPLPPFPPSYPYPPTTFPPFPPNPPLPPFPPSFPGYETPTRQ